MLLFGLFVSVVMDDWRGVAVEAPAYSFLFLSCESLCLSSRTIPSSPIWFLILFSLRVLITDSILSYSTYARDSRHFPAVAFHIQTPLPRRTDLFTVVSRPMERSMEVACFVPEPTARIDSAHLHRALAKTRYLKVIPLILSLPSTSLLQPFTFFYTLLSSGEKNTQ